MKLILIRHGQTVWNTQMRTQGRTDIPLDDTGRSQAERVALRLADIPLDAIYCSPLSRARDTAAAIAQPHGMEVLEHPLLMERDFGIWEGEPFQMLIEKYPEGIRQWERDPVAYTPQDAEPLSDMLARCISFLEEMRGHHTDVDTVLIVSHSIPLRLMVAHLIGLEPRRIHSIRLDNAAYTEVRLGEKYNVLTVLNYTGHLNEGMKCK